MRYPVGKDTSDYEKNWYIAQGLGEATSYGFHEGEDYNLKSGGDTDLGQPLHAVADGKIVYYHNASHPTTGFGRHMVLECQTSRGTRWYHYCHCQEITAQVKEVKEGEQIGTLGKSGTTYAHLHFAVFKVDPSGLYKGIDSIAKTKTELNASWEKFELLSMPENTKTELLTYLGVSSNEKAIEALNEHLGDKTVDGVKTSNWGTEGDQGGYLGVARKENRELREQLTTANTEIKDLNDNIKKRAEATEARDRADADYFDNLVVILNPLDVSKYDGMTSKEIVESEVKSFVQRESDLQKKIKEVEDSKAKEIATLKDAYERRITNLEKKLYEAEKSVDDMKKELEVIKNITIPVVPEKPISGQPSVLSRLLNSIISVLRRLLWW